MGEWIEHDGKGAPDLPRGTKAVVRFRDGMGFLDADPFEYWSPDEDDPHDYWTFSEDIPEYDIVAYRIAT